VTRLRDPIDLLAYGRGDLDELTQRWPAGIARAGVEVELPAGFSLARHAGPLPVRLRVVDDNAFGGAAELRKRGTLEAAFELYLEPLSPAPEGMGLRDVPAPAARRIRGATFCAVFTLWNSADAPCCIAAGAGPRRRLPRSGAGHRAARVERSASELIFRRARTVCGLVLDPPTTAARYPRPLVDARCRNAPRCPAVFF
jgi:hypothetical protein